jgi:hypothetical protein
VQEEVVDGVEEEDAGDLVGFEDVGSVSAQSPGIVEVRYWHVRLYELG